MPATSQLPLASSFTAASRKSEQTRINLSSNETSSHESSSEDEEVDGFGDNIGTSALSLSAPLRWLTGSSKST